MTHVHGMIEHASHSNALGRDEQDLVGIQKAVPALEEKVFNLEGLLNVDTNLSGKERLQSRNETALVGRNE